MNYLKNVILMVLVVVLIILSFYIIDWRVCKSVCEYEMETQSGLIERIRKYHTMGSYKTWDIIINGNLYEVRVFDIDARNLLEVGDYIVIERERCFIGDEIQDKCYKAKAIWGLKDYEFRFQSNEVIHK